MTSHLLDFGVICARGFEGLFKDPGSRNNEVFQANIT